MPPNIPNALSVVHGIAIGSLQRLSKDVYSLVQEHSMILCPVIKNQIPLSYQKEWGRQEPLISPEGLYKVTDFMLHRIPEFYKESAVQRHCIIARVTQMVEDKVRVGPDFFYFSTLALSSIDCPHHLYLSSDGVLLTVPYGAWESHMRQNWTQCILPLMGLKPVHTFRRSKSRNQSLTYSTKGNH